MKKYFITVLCFALIFGMFVGPSVAMDDSVQPPVTIYITSGAEGGMQASATVRTLTGVAFPFTPIISLIPCELFEEGAYYVYIEDNWPPDMTVPKIVVEDIEVMPVSEDQTITSTLPGGSCNEICSPDLFYQGEDALSVLTEPVCFTLCDDDKPGVIDPPEEPASFDVEEAGIIACSDDVEVGSYEVSLSWVFNEELPLPSAEAFFEVVVSGDNVSEDVCGVSLEIAVPCESDDLGLFIFEPDVESGDPGSWEEYGFEFVTGDPCVLSGDIPADDLGALFAIGHLPPEKKVVSGDVDGVHYQALLTKCPDYDGELPDFAVEALTMQEVAELPGLFLDTVETGDGIFFTVSFDPDSTGVCGAEFCFFIQESCEDFADVGLFYLDEDTGLWIPKEWSCSESSLEGYVSQVCVSFDSTEIEILEGHVWGAGPEELFAVSPSPGGDDDDDVTPTPNVGDDDDDSSDGSGGGGCSIGILPTSMLLLLAPAVIILGKKF